MIATKKNNRRVGQIRQVIASSISQTLATNLHKSQNIPPPIKDLTINNINLFNEMKEIDNNCVDVFDKYQEIIRNLQNVIQTLVDKNAFINSERIRLVSENIQLKKEIENIKESYFVADSRVLKNIAIFDVIPQQDSIPAVFPKQNKKRNQVLQQSQFDICSNNHHFNAEISAQLSLSDAQAKSQQRTPCLNRHHTMIQCKSNNNQSPLRVFYLLLLQQQSMIQKLKTLLTLCVQDDSKVLLYLLPKDNELWARILQQFLDSIIKGKFQNQSEIVEYISENPLIDMLLVSLLKLCLPLQNQDKDLNIGDWKNQCIDPRILFQGLCNQFDLRFQSDNQQNIYRFYINNAYQKSVSQKISQLSSEQNLLQSRTQMIEPNVEISLFNNNNKISLYCSQARQQPIFKIWIDQLNKCYRINISIRPDKYHETQQYQQNSFHQTENSQISQARQSRMRSGFQSGKQSYEVSINRDQRHCFKQIDMNKCQSFKTYYYPNQQYLKFDSKHITGSNSNVCQNLQLQ